jgi:hypothetical protein
MVDLLDNSSFIFNNGDIIKHIQFHYTYVIVSQDARTCRVFELDKGAKKPLFDVAKYVFHKYEKIGTMDIELLKLLYG